MIVDYVFFFKQKTAYELRISDWSSDVCSSDLTSRACAPDTRTEYFPKIRFQYCAEFGRVPARLQKRSYPSMPELLPNTPVASPWAPSPPCGHPCGTFRGRQARRSEVQNRWDRGRQSCWERSPDTD